MASSPASESAEGELTTDSLALGVVALSSGIDCLVVGFARCSIPPEYLRRGSGSKVGPRVDVADCPGYPEVTAGSVGYSAEAVELWREIGERPDDEALGECPEVYDMLLLGGVTAGVPLEW